MNPFAVLFCAAAAAVLPVAGPPTPGATPEPSPPADPATGSAATAAKAAPLVPFPHPLITEILYAVPNSDDGDANRDGTRNVAGDEFIELVNPHEKPIQLFGYTITDRNPPGKGQFKFTFPALELPPHAVVVVFNGCQQTWSGVGPVGDSARAPSGPNASFHDALIFTARAPNTRTSWANSGDLALLSDPAGQPVECVTWGAFKEKVPAAPLVETAPLISRASVQRTSLTGGFAVHPTSEKEPKASFSPGCFDQPPKAGAPAEAAAPKPAEPRKPGK